MTTILDKLNLFKYYLLLVIVAVFVLGANPFKGETVAPMDLLLNQTGWETQKKNISILHPERSDILVAYLPIWMLIKEKIYSGQLPLWLHERSGGLIGIQNLAWGTLTPAYLAFLMVKSNPLGFYLAGLVKLTTAGIGMFLFLRLFLALGHVVRPG